MFKCVVVGDSCTGKTCIVEKLTINNFNKSFVPTVGVEYMVKNYKENKLQIWCTSGERRFEGIVSVYFKGCNCFIIVYDVTDYNTFKNVTYWISLIGKQFDDVLFVLLGNKKEMEDEREVSTEEAKNFAENFNMKFEEVSAKTGENIEEVFREIKDSFCVKEETVKNTEKIVKSYRTCWFLW